MFEGKVECKKTELLRMTRRPNLHIMATMACNLRCSYCPVSYWLLDEPTDHFLKDETLIEIFERATEPYYMYMGGGEPLLSPDLPAFLRRYGPQGHKFTFDSNGTHNRKTLAKILDQFDTSCIGYFDISHHLDQRVPLKTIVGTCKELRSRNINHYVKYIARPNDLQLIEENIAVLESEGIGAAVCLYMGPNSRNGGELIDDRVLPGDYTEEEIKWLLQQVRLRQHIPPIFGGLNMFGKPCVGGNDHIVLGTMEQDRHKAWPCCHADNIPVDLKQTPFFGAPRGKVPCKVDGACFAYTQIEHGMLENPEETLADLFDGPVAPLSMTAIVEYIEEFCPTVAPAANQELYDRVLRCAKDLLVGR